MAAKLAALGEVDYRDDADEPIIDQPGDRASFEMGVDAGIRAVLRLVPTGDPTALAIEQLWLHQRWMANHLGRVATAVETLTGKLAEYEAVLPDPDSFIARAGKWGKKNGKG